MSIVGVFTACYVVLFTPNSSFIRALLAGRK